MATTDGDFFEAARLIHEADGLLITAGAGTPTTISQKVGSGTARGQGCPATKG